MTREDYIYLAIRVGSLSLALSACGGNFAERTEPPETGATDHDTEHDSGAHDALGHVSEAGRGNDASGDEKAVRNDSSANTDDAGPCSVLPGPYGAYPVIVCPDKGTGLAPLGLYPCELTILSSEPNFQACENGTVDAGFTNAISVDCIGLTSGGAPTTECAASALGHSACKLMSGTSYLCPTSDDR